MTRNLGILARLFGRSQQPAPLVSALFANAIGQPLLVHPHMGEQIVGAYMHGAIEARPALVTIGELAPEQRDATTGVVTPARAVAVLNVSGPLVNRFEPGMCDPGPLSYEALRAAYDNALADSRFEAIVLRCESPGGMGSGVFDLSDRINATNAKNGGQKRVIACIDDYAYSACFALAAACDEVWITRTGGAGSVGVIAYHVDQSAWDAKVGVKVTAIYAGEHKNDFSPHAPLSKDAHAWLLARMESMRTLFAESVAKYRGMDVAAVLATEAQVYQGEEAVAVGFADRIGTYHELMAELAAGTDDEEDKPEDKAAKVQAVIVIPAGASMELQELPEPPPGKVVELLPQLSAEDAAKRDRGTVADALSAAGLSPALTVALLSPEAGVTPETVDARIAHAKTLADMCFAAGLPDMAADYATKNTEIETARAQLLAAKAEDGPELVTAHPAPQSASKAPALAGSAGVSGASIRSRHRAAAAGLSLSKRQ